MILDLFFLDFFWSLGPFSSNEKSIKKCSFENEVLEVVELGVLTRN